MEIDLKNYKIIEKLGGGSFGLVFHIKNKKSNESFAAKISNSSLDSISDQEKINQFARETNILSKITHPTILSFYGFSLKDFDEKPFPAYIIQYAANNSLRHILEIERKGLAPPEWDDTKKYINIFGIAYGMSFLHQNNIIHRDLKPDNIMEDEHLLPKIGDFGLSKICDIMQKSMQSTIGGTPYYMAPEINAQGRYSYSVDVYAFSIILFEILTGQEPYKECENLSPFEISIKVIQNYRPKFPKNFKITDSMKELIERCWSQNPSDRPTFSEIVEILKNDDFINDSGFFVDKDDFQYYLDYLEDAITSFDDSKKSASNIENYIKNKQKSNIKKVYYGSFNINKQPSPSPPPPPPPPPPSLPPPLSLIPPLPPKIFPIFPPQIEYFKKTSIENILSQIKMSYRDTVEHLFQFDQIFNEEQILIMIKNLPTKEEIKMINEFEDKCCLGPCEQFYYELSKIPDLKVHFDFLFLLQTFNTRIKKITPFLNSLHSLLQIIQSLLFDNILFVALKIANGGAPVDKSSDIKKKYFAKLKEFKTHKPEYDFFKKIVQAVYNESPDSLSIIDQYSNDDIFSTFDAYSIFNNINDMTNIINTFNNCYNYMPKSLTMVSRGYRFYPKFKKFHEDHYNEINSNQKIIISIKEKYEEIVAMYGEEYSKTDLVHFLSIFSNFLSELKRAKK